jgi:hypothetical protein
MQVLEVLSKGDIHMKGIYKWKKEDEGRRHERNCSHLNINGLLPLVQNNLIQSINKAL